MNVEEIDHDDFRKLVEDRLLSACAQHAPDYPVQLDNVKFDQPKNKGWVSLCIKSGESTKRSIGSELFIERTPGFIQIDVTVPENTGHAAPRKIAHALCKELAYKKTSYATITSANFWKKMVDTGPVVGPYYRIMARVFFWYDGFVRRPALES